MDKDKLRMQTMDGVQSNIEKIQALFPHCVVESRDAEGRAALKVDFEQLQACLAPDLANERNLRYRFTWPDKHRAFWLTGKPIRKALRPCREESVDFDSTRNLYIEGDNLEVLKCLQETYLGQVKMIYIDPPYNTGHDFVYRDNYSMGREEYEEASGQRDGMGNRLTLNAESNGRFHTDWLNMMYPRLLIAQSLLREDGVIFISIDDNEVANLRKLCDEVFGERNFVGCIVCETATDNNPTQITTLHEYVLCYARTKVNLPKWSTVSSKANVIIAKYEELRSECCSTEEIRKRLRAWIRSVLRSNDYDLSGISHYDYVDEKGVFYPGNSSNTRMGSYQYDIVHPVSKRVCAKPKFGWRWPRETFDEAVRNGDVLWGADETTIPKVKKRIETATETLKSYFYEDGRKATGELTHLLGGHKLFDHPKSLTLVKKLVRFATNDTDDIVLDFFSGSATTAHAVMQLNAEDGGKRRYIMVQILEATDEKSEAHKAGYSTICEIGKERIRRAGAKVREEHPDAAVDTGFRVLRIDSTNMQELYYSPSGKQGDNLLAGIETVKPDRTQEDLLFQTMLELSITLDEQIARVEVEGNTLFNVGEAFLVACFDAKLGERAVAKMVELQPDYVVIRDAGGGDDTALVNCRAALRKYSSRTTLRIL